MRQVLYEPGVSAVTKLEKGFDEGDPRKLLDAGVKLSELNKDFVLFTYAPLFLYGGLTHNPIQEWINTNNHTEVVFILKLATSVFKLADKDTKFDNILWAVKREYWSSLAGHIGFMSWYDNKKTYSRVVLQKIPILDVNDVSLTTVNIAAFSLDSNKGCVVFEPATPPFDKPYLTFKQPQQDTIKIANAIFTEQ